jgi:hypothetical protein
MALNQSYPGLEEFRQNVAMRYNLAEVIDQPLYDYQIYPTAGLQQMVFFQNPIGQLTSASPGNAGNFKQLSDTNMISGGSLPAPQAFFCTGIEVDIDPGSSGAANTFAIQDPQAHVAAAAATVQAGEADVNAIYNSGALRFIVSTKAYYEEGPLYRFPPASAFRMDCAIASNSATAAEDTKVKLRVDGEPCQLNPGVGIVTSQNFSVTLVWPAVVATPSGFNARIGVFLRGYLFRAVQ